MARPRGRPSPTPDGDGLIDYDGDDNADVLLLDCQTGLTLCDVAVRTSPGSFTVIVYDVTVLLAFAIPRSDHSSANPVGAKLLWDTDGNGRPDGGAILIDFNRDGDFGEEGEIRVFGET